MRLAGAARLFLLYGIWRALGAGRAGRALVNALGDKDESQRAIAATLLARSGERAEPLVLEALRRREHLPMAIPLFGDVGRPAHADELEQLHRDPDPKIARAAKDALDVLRLRHPRGSASPRSQ
jgi:HEAT repeat protein